MSLSKFESDVRYIPQDVQTVYNRFADMRNVKALLDRIQDPAVLAMMEKETSADKIEMIKTQLQNTVFEEDSVQLSTPMGQVTLRIVEREEPKCIKYASENAPIPLYLWIQILPHGENETKIRVTVGAEVNIFMKGMVSKPLQKAANDIANAISVMR